MSLQEHSAGRQTAEASGSRPRVTAEDRGETSTGQTIEGTLSHDTHSSAHASGSGSQERASMSRQSLQKLVKRTSGRSPAPAALISHEELTDLRALQRTFDGAYTRTALAQLGYAILILRLFEREFYWCGLVYTILAVQLIGVATYRYNLAMQNKDRWNRVNISLSDHQQDGPSDEPAAVEHENIDSHDSAFPSSQNTSSFGPDAIHVPLFRRTFRTAGDVVALATVSTLVLEIVLVGLVIAM